MSNKKIIERVDDLSNLYPGYCKLCRREEIKLYDDCVGTYDEELHRQACLDAGCLHPAYYSADDFPPSEDIR